MTADYRLEASWSPTEGSFGRFTFALFNLSGETLSGFSLVYTSLTRVADKHVCQGATLKRRVANFHEFLPPEGLSIAPGGSWQFVVEGLAHAPKHVTAVVKSAYLTLADGRHLPVSFGDLMLDGAERGGLPELLPKGEVSRALFAAALAAVLVVAAG